METQHPEDNSPSPFTVQTGEDSASIAAVLALSVDTPPSEQDENDDYASCPVDGCGEALLLTELDSHIEMHAEEQGIFGEDHSHKERETVHDNSLEHGPSKSLTTRFDTNLPHSLRNLDYIDVDEGRRVHKQASAKAAWKGLLKMPQTGSSKETTPSSAKANRRLGVRVIHIF